MAKKKSFLDYIEGGETPAPKKPTWLDHTFNPTRTKEEDQVNASGFETFKGDSDYDQDLGHGMSQSYNRAVNQPWQDELGNALGRTALNIVPSIIGNLASVLDVEDYLNKDNEVGNEITRAMESLKQEVNQEVAPIYRKNPGEALNVSDSAWWFENGGNLLESAGAFVATGGIISKGLQMLPRLAKIGSAMKGTALERGTLEGLDTFSKAGQIATTAFTLNQAESVPIAMQVYDKVLQTSLSEGLSEEEAKQRASDGAAHAININRANVLLNLTSSMAFFRSPKMSRGLLEQINSAKRINAEGFQESLEEAVNLVGEKEGIRKGTDENYEYAFHKTLSDIGTAEGVESLLLGYVGGAVQTGGQAIINREQNKEHNARVAQQQNYHKQLDDNMKGTGTPSLFAFVQSAKDQSILQKKIEAADLKGDIKLSTELKNQLAEVQAFHAFENSSADKLEEMYREIMSMDKTVAATKGLTVDPKSPDDYRAKAVQAISKIKELEETYNELAMRLPKESLKSAYLNVLENESIRKDLRTLEGKVVKEQQKSFEEITAGLDLRETSNYEYLGLLTDNKKVLEDKLKVNATKFRDIVAGKAIEEQKINEENKKNNKPEVVSGDHKQLIKDFTNTVFDSEEDIQKAVFELPEELRTNKQILSAIRNKEQRVAYKEIFEGERKVKVKKNGKEIEAVVIPENYKLLNKLAHSHLTISENGAIAVFTPDSKKDKNIPTNDIPSFESNNVPTEIPEDIPFGFMDIPDPDSFIPTLDIPDPDAIIPTSDKSSAASKKTSNSEKRAKRSQQKQERELVKEIKNTEYQYQLTVDRENKELISGIGQKIGYDYTRLNNPKALNGEVKLTLGSVEGINTPFVFIEEDGVKVTKLIRTLGGVSDEFVERFQKQFDNIVNYIKNNGPVTTRVIEKKIDNPLNIRKGTQSGLDQLLTNDRAKQNLPDGQLYIGTVQGGTAQVRSIENEGEAGAVAIGNNPDEGRHFLVVKLPNGILYPVYLQDSLLKDIEIDGTNVLDTVIEQIEFFKNEFLQSDLPKTQKELNNFWNEKKKEIIPIVNINRTDGEFALTIGLKLEKDGSITTYQSKKRELPQDKVYEAIGNSFYNIQVEKLISDPKYTDFLVKNRILTTDLDTERPVINTQLKIDVSFLEHPNRLQATGEPVIQEGEKQEEKSIDKDLEELRKLEEELNPTIDPTKINDIKTRLVEKEDYKQINAEEEVEWIKNNLPQIPVEVVQTTLDIAKKFGKEAHGVFTDSMIYIAANGAVGTGYHEAFHAVFNLYLTEDQRTSFLKDKTEEQIADEFAEYVQTGQESNQSSISQFFKDIFYWFKDMLGLVTMQDIFNRIATGKFANSPIKGKSSTKFKVVEGFNPLEQKQRVETLLYEVFNGLKTVQNKGSIIALDIDNLSVDSYNQVWDKIKRMWDLRQSTAPHPSRKKVLDNWTEFKELTSKELNRFGIKAVERQEDEKVGEDTKERIYDIAYFKSNVKDTLSTEMKLFVATIPEIEKLEEDKFTFKRDELGSIRFIDRHKAYSDLSRELSDIRSIENMIRKLDFLAVANPQWYYVSDFLKRTTSTLEDVDVTSNNFRNKFYNTFRNHNGKFLTTKKVSEDIKLTGDEMRDALIEASISGEKVKSTKTVYKNIIFETNRKGLDKIIVARWKEENLSIKPFDAFTSFRNEVTKHTKEFDTRDNLDILTIVEKHLNSIGVSINLEALKLHKEEYFRKNYIGNKLKNSRTSYTNHLLKAGEEKGFQTIGQVIKSFSNGKNIFGSGEEVGEFSSIKELAGYQAKVSTDITGGAFLNGENDLVYPINSANYATNRILDLKEDDGGIIEKLLADPYYSNSKVVRELSNPESNFRNELNIYTFDTANDSTKKKQSAIPYNETQEFEFVSSKLTAFYNNGQKGNKKDPNRYGYFFPPTPADRGNVTPIKLPKLNINTPLFIEDGLNINSEFYKWLIGAVEDEFNRIRNTWDQVIPEEEQINNYHYRIAKVDGKKVEVKGNAYYFNQFWNLNSLIYEDVNNPELTITSFTEIDQAALYKSLSNTFYKLFENEKVKLDEKGIITYKEGKISIKEGILDSKVTNTNAFINEYVANQFYANFELSRLLSGDMAFYKGSPLTEADRKTQFADFDKRFGQSFVPGRELGYSEEFSDVVKPTFRVEIANDIVIENKALKDISKKYLENNQTDAQGFCTLERMREYMIGQGTFVSKYRKAWSRLKRGGSDASDISTVFQPIKGFYYSQEVNKYGIAVPTQVKYSVIPLIPAFTENHPELQKLSERMVTESIDEYVFESGIKVGRTRSSILELKNKNWRIPQVVPYKDTTEERFGSQKRKLITENIDETDEFEGKNLKQYYQELISKTIEEDFKKVAPELENIDKVAETLLQQLLENNTKGLPDKFEKALEVIDTEYGRDTRMSMDHPLIKKRIESIFNSFIDSRVVDQKLPGFSAVQVSTFGHVKVASDLKFVRLEGDKVLPAEVKVSPKYFIKMLKKKKLKIEDFLTDGKLDIKKIPANLLKGTIHRIPTQGKNSMLPIKIIEFTPNEYGSVIFLPVEVTTQAGSDFDIDKVFIEMYNFEVVDGKLEKIQGDTTKAGRQNKIIDIHYDILTNPKYFEELVTPNNTDTLSKIKDEILSFTKKDDTDQYWFSPSVQEEFKSRNQAGKQLVGFYSIASVSHSVAQDIRLTLVDKTVNFEGKNLLDLSSINDIEGTRISDNIAEVQTAAVDNAKEPILGYLNDNLFTAPVKALLLRAGVPLRQTNYFATQPIILELTKDFFRNSPSMSDSKALQLAVLNITSKYDFTVSKDPIPANFTLAALEDGLKGKGDPKLVLEAFLAYKKMGDELYSVSLGLSPDRKGTASTMSENLYNQRKIKDAKASTIIKFNKEAYDNHSLAAFEKYGINEAIDLAKIYFSDGTKVFTTVHKTLELIKGDGLSVKELQDITYQFYTYLHTGADTFKLTNEEKLDLLKGDKSVVNKLRRYRIAHKEKREDNAFLNTLNIVRDEDTGFEYVEFNAAANPALSPEEKQLFEDSILELYRAGGAKKTFAVDLLKYSFVTNGFNRGTNGFIDYIPIEMFEDLGLSTYYRDIKKDFKSIQGNKFNLDRFIDQYVQNNFDVHYWIPQYNKKNLAEKLKEEKPDYYYNTSTKKLHKFENGTYIEINKLGIINQLKEYDINSDLSSIIPSNNKSSKKQVESELQEITTKQLVSTLDKLSERFGIKYELDYTLTSLGKFSNGKVFINPNLAKEDTAFHEFAHPFVEVIRQKNPILYKNLEKQVNTTVDGVQAINKVKRLYPELNNSDQVEEAIVQLLGEYAANRIKDQGIIAAIKTFFKRVLSYLTEAFDRPINPDALNANTTLDQLAEMLGTRYINIELDDSGVEKFQKQDEEEQSEFARQEEFFRRKIVILQNNLKKFKEGSIIYRNRLAYINSLKEKVEAAKASKNADLFNSLGSETLDGAEEFIKKLEEGKAEEKALNILYTRDVLDTWIQFEGLMDRSSKLYKRLVPFIESFTTETVQTYATEKEPITKTQIDSQNKDINTFTGSVGALADLSNYFGRTIGSIIKSAQNIVSTKGKTLRNNIQKEVDELLKYATANNKTLDEVYEMMVQESKGTLVLAKRFLEDHKENPNFKTIQSTPELKRFYDFYQKSIKSFEEGLPLKVGKYFIPNFKKDGLKETLKDINPFKERKIGDSIEEDLLSDKISLRYLKPLEAKDKSSDLAKVLLDFGKFSYNYKEMSEILPKVRLLQEQLTFRITPSGSVVEREFFKSSNSTVKIPGRKTNLYKMVDTIIEMQVKGVMKKDEGDVSIETIYDEEGNPVKEKYFDTTGLLDNLMRWNSLVRIGLSPITAISNVLFGDISNVIEAVGGRYFGLNDLRKASDIFIKQTWSENSVLNKLLEELNPLQELDDYEKIDAGLKKKISKEKIQELMYSPQKKGEKFLQSRTMLAIMIKEELLTKDGKLTPEYYNLTDLKKEQLVDKIQRVNQMIHGRYTQREAAALQQSVIFRLVSQFRKWIPAAIENRIGSKQYDNRLQADIEGRYRTLGRVVGKEFLKGNIGQGLENLLLPLFSMKKALEKGNLTEMEVYNMRKNLVEIMLTTAAILAFGGLRGDDEDKEWRKNPWVKTGLTLLNRVSGDLLFFYNPESVVQMSKNIAPSVKLIDDVITSVTYIPNAFYVGDWEIKSGSRKGDNRFYSKVGGVAPGIKPYLDIRRILNDERLEELK